MNEAPAANPGVVRLNSLSVEAARQELHRCCGSRRWVEGMVMRRPFASEEEVYEAAEDIWFGLTEQDWLEAFSHHPKIGDLESLRAKFAATSQWSQGEQSGVQGAGDDVLEGLRAGNEDYERKFGFIFIVCATGKSARAMLDMLNERFGNDRKTELKVAAAEQGKITRIRLEKLWQQLL